MHTDARTLEDESVIEADLCIVGAGAAGISLAMEFLGTSHDVVLLEAGGFNLDLDTQRLYAGKSIGAPYQVPLEAARLHYFGGTTNHWSGFCATLDPIDFEKRDWVPYSGWPISRAELDPYYERAHTYAELGPYEYDAAALEEGVRRRLPLDEERFWTKIWRYSPPTRFGQAYRNEIVNAPNIHLFTHAVATEVLTNEPVTSVDEMRVQTLNGKAHRVRARHFVLACNTIQNARLLLASNRQAPKGLGNDNDLVGRFFMEHFEMVGSQLVLHDSQRALFYEMGFVRPTKDPNGELAMSSALQREHGVLNGTVSLRKGRVDDEALVGFFESFANSSRNEVRQAERRERGEEIEESQGADVPPELAAEGERFFRLQSRSEQSPNPSSRVVLSEERDALGMPYANLNWQLQEIDKRSMRVFHEELAREMGRHDLGRVQVLDWLYEDDHEWPSFLSGGFHNMGTTRMHEDPKQGVLDADGKVYGIANLYAAGGSAFPTAGAANPTLTIIALTIRLSDHLKSKMT